MSNYYLCDVCARKMDGDHVNTCICVPSFPREHRKKVMFDHHGKGGKRYDEPRDVCRDFEPRRDER